VRRCLEKNPGQRFQSAADLAFALETVVDSGSVPIAPPRGSTQFFLARPGKAVRYGALCVLAFVVLATAVLLTPSSTSGPLDSTQITYSAEPKEGPLFTDGARLYFEIRGVPSQMAASGGMIVPMKILEPGLRLLDISADGSKALALQQDLDDNLGRGTLWVANILGGGSRKLTGHLAVMARWSPDGRSIVFSDGKTLYRLDADGANSRAIGTRTATYSTSTFPRTLSNSQLPSSPTESVICGSSTPTVKKPTRSSLIGREMQGNSQGNGRRTGGISSFFRTRKGTIMSTSWSPLPGSNSGKKRRRFALPAISLIFALWHPHATARTCL
jgi:hypothetical protein